MKRDLIGYGLQYPKIKWPEDAQVAVSLVLNYEEGAELCIGDGDPKNEKIGEFFSPVCEKGMRDFGMESMYEYGSRAGTRRVLNLFKQFEVKSTIYACGRALERNPDTARAFIEEGHEIAGHGYLWVNHFSMEKEVEREQIQKTIQAAQTTSGERPVGWYTRYAPSPNTRELLVEEGGFLYDSDSYADELPYWVEVQGKQHLVIPYQLDANDFKYYFSPGWSGAGEFGEYLCDSVKMLLKEGKTEPKMLSVGLHGRIIGRPGRAVALERFLEFCRNTPGIWLTRRIDIARWWHEQYPAE